MVDYWQEIGRYGRNRIRTDCITLYHESLLNTSITSEKSLINRLLAPHVGNFKTWATQDRVCQRVGIAQVFGIQLENIQTCHALQAELCDVCVQICSTQIVESIRSYMATVGTDARIP